MQGRGGRGSVGASYARGTPEVSRDLLDPDGEHLWFHSTTGTTTTIYRYDLLQGELEAMNPPGFSSAAHVTRARNGAATFDSITQ